MQSITLDSRVGQDGVLKLSVPLGLPGVKMEVMIIVQSVTQPRPSELPDGLGWPEASMSENPVWEKRTPGPVRRLLGNWLSYPEACAHP